MYNLVKLQKKNRLNKRGKGEKLIFIIVFILFVFYFIGIIYPYIFGFNASLKENGRAFMRDMVGIANPMNFGNYRIALSKLVVSDNSFFMMTFNSLWYSIGTTGLSLFFCAMSTYVVCFYRNAYTRFIYNLVIFTMILPIVGSGPASYRLIAQLGLMQSPLILVVSMGGLLNLILYAYFKVISWTYAEAAMIDGAGHFTIYFKIMLPQALPIMSILFATGVVGAWNDYSTPILYLNESYPTLASGLYVYESKIKYLANQPVFFAGALMAALPPVILFALMQNFLMTRVYLGGIKG